MSESFISNLTLARDLQNFRDMVDKNASLSEEGLWATDFDLLLGLAYDERTTDITWSAPKGFPAGSPFFVYHTRSAEGNVRALLRQTPPQEDRLRAELHHALHLGRIYGGTIFAAAMTSSGATLDVDGNYSASVDEVYILPEPLPYEEFKDVVNIAQGAVRRLGRGRYEEIRDRITRSNPLPDFLA